MTRRCRLVGPALAVLMLAGAVRAQEAAPRKVYTRKAEFRLPIQLADSERADLAEIKLYVKALPGDWACRETAPAGQAAFSFRAPQDGEYWFTFLTVDHTGRTIPTSPAAEPPGLVVVVDTQPPQVELRPLTGSAGQVYLQCRLIDANPDYPTVEAEYEADGKWRKFEPMPDTPGVFLVPDKQTLDGKIHVRGADRAGNVIDRVMSLASPKPAAPAAPAAPVRAIGFNRPPAMESPPIVPLPPPVDVTTAGKIAPPAQLPAEILNPPQESAVVTPASAERATPRATREPQMVNALRCRIDFSVNPPLPAPAVVELWATPDGGKTWQLHGTSTDGRGPAVATFPSDGVFGYSFVVRGPGSAPPAPGDAPDGWVEVDTTLPVAELLGVTPLTGTDAGTLQISWVAHDKNLGPTPVALYYALQPDGPWQPIAGHLANTGSHRWPLPKDLGGRLHLRLEVVDRAGNLTRCDSPGAVSLDAARPKVTVLSVTPARE